MFVVGAENQQAGHSTCVPPSFSPLINHLAELSSRSDLGPLSPRRSYPCWPSPHTRSFLWQGGRYVVPLQHH